MKRYFLSLSLTLAVASLVQSSPIQTPKYMNQQDYYHHDEVINIKQQQAPANKSRMITADKSHKQGQWRSSQSMVA